MQTQKPRVKRPIRAIFLGLMILMLGIFSVSLGAIEFYTSMNLAEPWANGMWAIFAGNGLMMIPHVYAILDLTIGLIFLFCSYFIFRVKHMEFAALTAFATGLVALFVFGTGDWWTYVGEIKYEGLGVMFMRVVMQGGVPLAVSAVSLTVQREEAKTLMGRRIRGFWEDFSHNKIGLVGIAIIFAYIAAAVLVPVLSLGLDPDATDLADELVSPEWTSVFIPSLSNLPRTTRHALSWSQINLDLVPDYIKNDPNFTIEYDGDVIKLNMSGVAFNETAPICIGLQSSSFYYPYDPPRGGGFAISFEVEAEPRYRYNATNPQTGLPYIRSSDRAIYNVEFNFTTPVGTYSMWDALWDFQKVTYLSNGYDQQMLIRPINITPAEERVNITTRNTHTITLTTDLYWAYRMGYVDQNGKITSDQLSKDLFKTSGNYTFSMYLFVINQTAGQPVHFYAEITPVKVVVKGLLWGWMGTDHLGRDVWSRIIHGVKISLAIGLASAVASSFIGVLVGVVAGYLGGTTDELLMRLVDILLCLPVLPLLIVLVYMYGQNVWYIVILIAVFGWQGLSRVIRSQVLSLREAAFVECATASGASRTYIMIRHLVPNVLPIVLSDFVLSVPGGIMTEAGLSFIGFGDPRTPTWGREFNIMWNEGGAFSVFAWWWIIPPAVAITTLCLAFVFLGHAVDEIVNPRLRRRR